MNLLAINGEGELYAPHGVTDTPQYAPGVSSSPEISNATETPPLTERQRAMVMVSSHTEGRDGFYALDGTLTNLRPADDDETPVMTVNLQAPYLVGAARIIWRDIGLDYDGGAVPEPIRFILEGRPDNDIDKWITLVDASDNDTELHVDYREIKPVSCESVRLRICGHPARYPPRKSPTSRCSASGTRASEAADNERKQDI